ncbi:1165_t:CDS:2 [Entrophospora sp. SA101]|nr:1165_t:CDS:2 [Entrophospora sp. SA101]
MPKNIAKPSKMSQTNIWTKYQTKNDAIILNLWLHIAAGLPLGLCHPIFHSFQKEVFGKVELDDLPEARPFQEEKQRKFYAKNMLEKYLESTFIEYKFDNNRSTDGSIMFINGSFETLLLSMEVKPEIGIGNGCPYIQGTVYYTEFIKKFQKTDIIKKSQFSVFLLQIAGPWLGVSDAAYTKKSVCEPLTPMMPLFVIPQSSISYNEEYGLMHQTACVLCILKNKLANLKEWYEDFQHKTPKINAIRSPQLHFPYINFITKNRVWEKTKDFNV